MTEARKTAALSRWTPIVIGTIITDDKPSYLDVMISPLARRLVSHHAKAVASRSVLKVINPSSVARRAVPSIAFPSHQLASIPFQSARMSSSNPANKNFTREHLFDCKDRIALVTGKPIAHQHARLLRIA
ncbi:hypothetical protein NUW58_g4492 [Xylaria curta]|uniref:Uncharacterized protein n=1 Tax=Xylaria curta TaxID=42375 RepID=A0ACC1P692_9PEZI|nr:hypothetical protein NUW58_g4492 [Xylaria curta]